MPLGTGRVLIAADTGAPLAFEHPQLPGHSFLLGEGAPAEPWHTEEHRWGSGFVITDRGAGRWQHPNQVAVAGLQIRASYPAVAGLRPSAERDLGERLVERYAWRNQSDHTITIGSLGINTPFRDLYVSAADALASGVHAHVFTGGSWAWVLAEPMGGQSPVLGLILRAGQLGAYSVESRNSLLHSHSRGHLVLQVTDHARSPHAFGGQQPIIVEPGGTLTVGWEVGWFPGREGFLAATQPPATIEPLAAQTGDAITITGADGHREQFTSGRPGVTEVRIGGARTAVLFHPPLRELISARVRFILERHRDQHRADLRRHAFLPVHTHTSLTQTSNGWADWSDGSERLAMPSLLQEVRLRGWTGDEIDDALRGFAAFARSCLLRPDGTPRRGSYEEWKPQPRIYDSPWHAHFFATQYRIFADDDDLALAETILETSYRLGADRHLSIGQGEAVLLVAELLDDRRGPGSGDQLRARLLDSARYFAAVGTDLPAHEVNYEQSIAAPLVSLLAAGHALAPSQDLFDALTQALTWLRRFGGPQPHVRLHDIAIRHWDGYWFGARRQWGDTFPHYWSCLTGVALTQLPDELSEPDTLQQAEAIFRANLCDFGADGTASCAFVMPSAVDGQPAHCADPLANDQDWALVLWLRAGTPAVAGLAFGPEGRP